MDVWIDVSLFGLPSDPVENLSTLIRSVMDAIDMLAPVALQLRSLVAFCGFPEIIDKLFSFLSSNKSASYMDKIVICAQSVPLVVPRAPSISIGHARHGIDPIDIVPTFAGENVKTIIFSGIHFPEGLVVSPRIQILSISRSTSPQLNIGWSETDNLLHPLQSLHTLELDLTHVRSLPPLLESKTDGCSLMLPRLKDVRIHGSLQSSILFLSYLFPSVTTLQVILDTVDDDQAGLAHSPICFNRLVSMDVRSDHAELVCDFLSWIRSPFLASLFVSSSSDSYPISDPLPLPLAYSSGDFGVPKKFRIRGYPASVVAPLLLSMNLEAVEYLYIEDLQGDGLTNVSNLDSYLEPSHPLQTTPHLCRLLIHSHRYSSSFNFDRVDQIFRIITLPSGASLEIDWHILDVLNIETLRRALFELRTLDIRLGREARKGVHILENFQLLTQICISLPPANLDTCEWLKCLIAPYPETHLNYAEHQLILPNLENLRCQPDEVGLRHFFNEKSEEWHRVVSTYMEQIVSSRRMRGCPLKKATLWDIQGGEKNFD